MVQVEKKCSALEAALKKTKALEKKHCSNIQETRERLKETLTVNALLQGEAAFRFQVQVRSRLIAQYLRTLIGLKSYRIGHLFTTVSMLTLSITCNLPATHLLHVDDGETF